MGFITSKLSKDHINPLIYQGTTGVPFERNEEEKTVSSYSLGFLFIPLSRPIATNTPELLQRALETLGGIQQVREINVFRADEDIRALSHEQACKLLGQHEQGGRITIDIAGFNTDLWFTPNPIQSEEGYRYLRIEIP